MSNPFFLDDVLVETPNASVRLRYTQVACFLQLREGVYLVIGGGGDPKTYYFVRTGAFVSGE